MPHHCPFPVEFSDNRRCYRSGITPGFTLCLLLVAVLAGFAGLSEAASRNDGSSPKVEKVKPYLGWARGRLLIAPRAGLPAGEFEQALKPQRGRSKLFNRRLNTHIVELPAGADEAAALKELRKNRKFKYVELDMAVEHAGSVSDPNFGSSWALPKIGAPGAWDVANGNGVTIAILDTGVDAAHPDLVANLVPGWNVYDNSADTADTHGHGTSVAGVAAAAANNAKGSAGVAWGARIMPVRISAPDGFAFWSTVAQGIYWAADHGAKVVNVSFNGISGSSSVQAAAEYMRSKGGVVVVAAGNSGGLENIAAHDALLSVAATDSSDARAGFSSYGPYVDIAAPGVSIYTTTRGGGYANGSGTSFASPVVAATAALMLSANRNLKAADVDRLLKSTALDLGASGADDFYGAGRVDAAGAVRAARALGAPDTQAPMIAITSPAGGRVSSTVPVDVSYDDNVGVVRAELYVNGAKVATDEAVPYAFAWDTSAYADGSYTLTARAFDAAGNQGVSAPVAVTLGNDATAPTIGSFNLTQGMRLASRQTIQVSASDDKGVAKISLSINGKEVAVSYGSSLNYTLVAPRRSFGLNSNKTVAASPKAYTITVRVTDNAGNVISKTVTVYQ